MFKKILFLILFFLLFPQKTFAATFTFDGTPSSIVDNQSFSLNLVLSISNSSGKNYYIRPAFSHPDSPTSYFGYIKNNSGSWYNVSSTIDKTQLYMITMDENDQWTGSIEVKPDPESSEYKGSGNYNFKLGRYTETGSTVTWCNNETVSCSIAAISITSSTTPTPTPAPTSTPTPTPAPSSTKTPAPTKTPTPKPISTPLATSISVSLATDGEVSESSVLSESSQSSQVAVIKDPISEPIETKVASENNLQPIFIGAGIILLTGSGYLVLRSLRKNE